MSFGCCCCAVLLLAISCAGPRLVPATLESQWAEAVLFGSEIGDARECVVRWPAAVRYLVVAADSRQRAATERAFAQLRDTLLGLAVLRLDHVPADDERLGRDGYVSMFFTAPVEARQLVDRVGAIAPSPDANGWFTIRWNRRHELARATIFVDPALEERWLRHTVLEEMVQVLGLSNDSPLLPDSIVFESATQQGSRDTLSIRDRRLLRLLYGALSPGQTRDEFRRAMQCVQPSDGR